MKLKFVPAFVVTALIAGTAFGQAKPEDQIRIRQSTMAVLAYSSGRIKSQVENPRFNRDQVTAAAQTIAGIANSGIGNLHGAGTDKGTGWKPSRLKPEYFEQPEKAREIEAAFTAEANTLLTVAALGDSTAIKAQLAKVSETCAKCHQAFRVKEEPAAQAGATPAAAPAAAAAAPTAK